MNFPYSVVAITGASTGLGAAMARQLGAAGCKLGLIARSADKLAELAREIGPQALALPCDVADFDAVKQAVAALEATHGPVECMIANAGISQTLEPGPWDPAIPERIMRTNYLGMINSLYACAPGMVERKRGHLVGVASLASYQGLPHDGGYAASKAAQRLYLESLRVQLHGSGVRVTTLCPGFVRTRLTDKNNFDMQWLLEADDAARRMLRAIAQGRRVYNFPWPLWATVKFGLASPRWAYDLFMSRVAMNQKPRRQPFSDGTRP